MIKAAYLTAAALTLALATACVPTDNRIVDKLGLHRGSYFGELGVSGNQNEVIIDRRSRLTKLSIIGDDNNITVEAGATLGKIEIWGVRNTISVPEHLLVRVNQIGEGNTIERRPSIKRRNNAFENEILSPEEAVDSNVMPPTAADPVPNDDPMIRNLESDDPIEVEATDLPN